MVRLGWRQLLIALARNQAHRLLGGALRGGTRTSGWPIERQRRYAESIFGTLAPHLENPKNLVGLEIGPGDNIEVCRLFLQAGARRMYAVEKFARDTDEDARLVLIRSEIENIKIPEPIDFAYSNDVLEHLSDVPAAMRVVFAALRPGGQFVSSIDLRGHNVFGLPERPLDFLTCPDRLWRLMFSHISTTNRVRAFEFSRMAEQAGFSVVEVIPQDVADVEYLKGLRPHLLPRYRDLPDEDLRILQMLLALQKPG